MFGAFYSGSIYFGKSIWGPSAPVRTNPDVDGGLVITFIPVGELGQSQYDSGAFTRTDSVKASFSEGDSTEVGYFTNTSQISGDIKRIK